MSSQFEILPVVSYTSNSVIANLKHPNFQSENPEKNADEEFLLLDMVNENNVYISEHRSVMIIHFTLKLTYILIGVTSIFQMHGVSNWSQRTIAVVAFHETKYASTSSLQAKSFGNTAVVSERFYQH
jgi:hypothetical protein